MALRPSLLSALSLVLVAPARAQIHETEVQKIVDVDGGADEEFGWSVDVDGATLVSGAPRAQTQGGTTGAAFVFRRDDDRWVLQQRLVASDAGVDDRFGESVAISGDTLLVGAPQDDEAAQDSGAVYVFEWDGASWVERQKLRVTDLAPNLAFGRTLAADGDRVAVGAPFAPRGRAKGEVYVYVREGSGFVLDQRLTASDGDDGERFGSALAIEGSTVLVGAPRADGGTGAAYVYAESDGFWVEDVLRASDATNDDLFGTSTAISGPWIAVGAVNDGTDRGRTGSVYRFHRTGGEWIEVDSFVDPSVTGNDRFGSAVALDGDTLVVGAEEEDGEEPQSGRVFTYRYDAERWVDLRVLDASDAIRDLNLGGVLALDGSTLVAGTDRADDRGLDSGAAYVFRHTGLALDVRPDEVRVGDAVRLLTAGGLRGGFVVLYVLFVDGFPFPRWITSGVFRNDGHWDLQNTVPPGLSGIEMTLGTIGFLAPGEIGESNREVMRFE